MPATPFVPYTPAMAIVVYLGWIMSIVSIACAVGVRTSRKVSRWVANIPLSTWSFTTIVLAIGTYFLFLSQQVGLLVEEGMGIAFVDSVVRTIKCFSASDEATLVEQAVHHYFAPGLDKLYLFTNSLAHLAAPVDTLMGIFILFTKFFGAPVLRLRASSHDTYVFSRLNDRSMRMAQNIVSHYRSTSVPYETENCLIAFARTADQEGDPLYNDAITHGMVCLDQPAYAVARFLGSSAIRHHYIFADDDEIENLQEGTRFVRDYVTHAERHHDMRIRRPSVHLLSSTPVAESFVDAATADAIVPWSDSRKPVVSVRRADWVRNTIEMLLWHTPTFLTCRPSETAGDDTQSLYHLDHRRVVIVGAGTLGYEFLKAALWCSQLGDVHVSFDVIDLKADGVRKRLGYEAPEVLRLNGDAPGAEYDISFHAFDVETGDYLEHLRTHRGDITHVLVALGNDLVNVRVARRTREILEQSLYTGAVHDVRAGRPLVAAVVSDGALAESVEGMATGNGTPYDIMTVGSYDRIFSFENIFHFELDRLGRNVNRAYWGCYDGDMSEEDLRGLRASADAEYERLEYNRRSSRASAIHLKYDLYASVRRACRMGECDEVPTSVWLQDFYDERDGRPTDLSRLVDWYERQVLSASEGEQAQQTDSMEWISRIEHDRWDAYMRTEGYEVAQRADFEAFVGHTHENQNRLAKQHVCLVPYEMLDEVSAFVHLKTMRDRDLDYKLADDKIVRHLADIVRDFEP